MPAAARVADDVVNLELGADVDALRRLVEQQDARVGRQPLRRDDLLLIAAAQAVREPVDATAS